MLLSEDQRWTSEPLLCRHTSLTTKGGYEEVKGRDGEEAQEEKERYEET